jgi:alkylhydroperoxidase family enzyme
MADEVAGVSLDPPRLERLVMQYPEAMCETPPTVDNELVKRLRAHLDAAQLVELTAIVCVENYRSRFISALGMVPQGFKERCTIPALKAAA